MDLHNSLTTNYTYAAKLFRVLPSPNCAQVEAVLQESHPIAEHLCSSVAHWLG